MLLNQIKSLTTIFKSNWHLIIVGVTFICFSFYYINLDSPTTDEALHLKSGIEWLTLQRSPSDPINPPLAKLLYGALYQHNPSWIYSPNLAIPRLISVIVSLLTIISLYYFCLAVDGPFTAKIAITFLSFEPLFIAHGHLAATDIWATLFFSLSSYFAYQINHSKTKYHAAFILCLNLLIASKTIYAIPFLFVILAHFRLRKIFTSPKHIVVISLSSVLIQWSVYGLTFAPILGFTPPLPLGEFFNTALHTLSYGLNSKFQQTRLLIYFSQVRGQGWFSYPLIAFVLKNSPFFLLLSIFGLIKHKQHLFTQISLILLIYIILARYNTGARQLLPIYPLLAYLAAKTLVAFLKQSKIVSFIPTHSIILFIFIFQIAQLSFINDPLSYFNPIIGSKKGGYIISDSNINWGQSFYRLLNNPLATKLDYIAPSTSVNYSQFTSIPLLPPNQSLTANLLSGKQIAVSRTVWYKGGYYQNPIFEQATNSIAINDTYLFFNFPLIDDKKLQVIE